MTSSDARSWIGAASVGIESLAVAIIIIGIAYASVVYLRQLLRLGRVTVEDPYTQYKVRLGRSLLLGLEILVAADVVRTVALQPTLQNVLNLGILVVIRTFLSWSLFVELQGRWPWQSVSNGGHAPTAE